MSLPLWLAEYGQLLSILLLFSNGLGLGMMLGDKFVAQRGMRRVSEKTLWLCGALFGSAGCLLGMYTFRHKTRKKAFVFGMPTLFVLQLACIAWVAYIAGYFP